jgi:hypothetical protein
MRGSNHVRKKLNRKNPARRIDRLDISMSATNIGLKRLSQSQWLD